MNVLTVSIHVAAAIILVLTVLLQAGKGAGMGSAFGGSSGTVFGTRGPATLISKITCVAAVVFMCSCLALSLAQSGPNKNDSVMDDWQASAPAAGGMATPAPAKPAETAPAEATGTGSAAKPAETAPVEATGTESSAKPAEEAAPVQQ